MAEKRAMHDVERLAQIAVDCGFRVHKGLGPGLLESVYEAVLAEMLRRSGLEVERQKPISIEFEGMNLGEGFRADLVVEGQLLIEVKSVERLAPVHGKQVAHLSSPVQVPARAPDEFRRRDVPGGRQARRQQLFLRFVSGRRRCRGRRPQFVSHKDTKAQRGIATADLQPFRIGRAISRFAESLCLCVFV